MVARPSGDGTGLAAARRAVPHDRRPAGPDSSADPATDSPAARAAAARRTGAGRTDAADQADVDGVFGELTSTLFASLRRSDQRARGEQYIQGLLRAEGRKSIRNLASAVGGAGTEQSLHHFVSSSTWDWVPMRRALAAHLERTQQPRAWVLQSMPIAKSGDHSVGVDRRFVSDLGHSVRGQHSFGVWFAGEEMSAPVNWRLFLSDAWLEDEHRRHQADIPDTVDQESMAQCGASAVLETLRWNVRPRPVVLPSRDCVAGSVLSTLRGANLPVVARLQPGDPLLVADPAMPGYGAGPVQAARMLQAVRGLRRPVEWTDHFPGGSVDRAALVAGIRVTLPQAGRRERPAATAAATASSAWGAAQQWLLFGEWEHPDRPPTELWLTDLTDRSLENVVGLAKLSRRVVRDSAETGEQVGLRDFVGRSYQGWHRHLTLASAAHAAAMSAALARGGAA
ncbi:putative transposase [Kitasatospora setae KM-6054]|uniref:Putative transposase n=1 Tax=Kitasatospora setae (strain ATCC 33774 / DSM 43861 / JCM 3304 / KCC A-0304 / NBRC 14216 / KM-6054) TaxID=452652 RepID=E4N0K0_KITSK|nr:putative transposase [Kitasatospora setae KM-6054]